MSKPIEVTIVGGGMITNDLLLPSIYHLQRTGVVKGISICALNTPPLKALAESKELNEAFPGQGFTAYPALTEDPKKNFPTLYKEVLAKMPPRQAVGRGHARPVPLRRGHGGAEAQPARAVRQAAGAASTSRRSRSSDWPCDKGLFVGVEYHKRFDRRSLVARRQYALGHFGEFVMGEAKLIEPYYYRFSNFQNWFTADKTDPFVYVGCHYVDLVYFITGLKPVEVSVSRREGQVPQRQRGLPVGQRPRALRKRRAAVRDRRPRLSRRRRRQQRPGPDHVLRGQRQDGHDPARRPVPRRQLLATSRASAAADRTTTTSAPTSYRLVPVGRGGLQARRLRL